MKSLKSEYIRKIADYFRTQPITRAWLFGSYSRGEETADSDIDILVDYDKSSKVSLLKICHIMTDLEDILGKRVDLVENGRLKDFAITSANQDKILIYERTT